MNTLHELQNIDLKTIDRSTLVQRETVKTTETLSQEERLCEYITQIKNPYCYLDGKTVIKISFSNTDLTMEDCISHYLKGL